MAERPVFVPVLQGKMLVHEVSIEFKWHSGMAPSQKRKNVRELHEAALERGYSNLLEVSSKSDRKIGEELSAFNLKLDVQGRKTTVECAFQSSKIFENGGPYHDLLWVGSREARGDKRLKDSGKLIGFEFDGDRYPLSPPTAFYDWLYVNALYRYCEWHDELVSCSGFTDIEFNPAKSINCQARSVATFVALDKRNEIGNALESFSEFRNYLSQAKI